MTKQEFRQLVGEAIGQASMLWTETPQGTFKSDKGLEILERIVAAAEALNNPTPKQMDMARYIAVQNGELAPTQAELDDDCGGTGVRGGKTIGIFCGCDFDPEIVGELLAPLNVSVFERYINNKEKI